MSPCRGLLPLLLLLWLCLAAPAEAAGGVEDRAGLFGHDARARSDDAIEEIRHRTHKDLLIETVKILPPEKLQEYRALKNDPEQVARFFRLLAEDRARRSDVDGVYVLLCRVPADAEPRRGLFRFVPHAFTELRPPQAVGCATVVWPPANDAYFPKADRDRLDSLFGDIKPGKHNQDQVLLEAVAFAGNELEANARALGAPPADSFRWTDALWAAAVLAGAWAVLGVVRARVARRREKPGPVPGADQATAALFGIAGALWLFEAYRACRQEGSSAPVPVAAEPPAPPDMDDIPPDDPMHPDDRAALTITADPWAREDTEATTGHDLP